MTKTILRVLVGLAAFVASATPTSAQSIDLKSDLTFLTTELPRLHAAPWLHTPRQAFDSASARLMRRIDSIPPNRAILEMARLVAMLGNGHTEFQLFSGPNAFSRLPVRLARYGDTLRVMVASAEHRNLLGARVVRFGTMDARTALRAIEPYLASDNPMEFMHQAPTTLASPEVLHALGATRHRDTADIVFALESGDEVRTILPSVSSPTAMVTRAGIAGVIPPWSAPKPDRAYWFEIRPDLGLAYFRLDQSADQRDHPTIESVAQEFFRDVDASRPSVLVLDVRSNSGGNNYRNQPLVAGIASRKHYHARGGLFVITGRTTFSAGTHIVRDLLSVASPIIVGERSRGDPRVVVNRESFDLPSSRFIVDYTDVVDVQGTGDSAFLPLDIDAPPSFSFAISGRDPAMEAIVRAIAASRKAP